MKNLTRSLALAGCLLTAGAASAQVQESPTITVQQVERVVSARAAWGSEDPQGPSDGDSQEVNSDGLGSFVNTVYANVGLAEAFASQDSDISSYKVRGEGEVFADLSPAPYEGKATASSVVNLQFTIPVEAPFVLRGSFTFEPTDAEPQVGLGNVSLIGADPFIFKQVGSSDPEEDWDFLFVGTAPANSLVVLGVLVLAEFEKEGDGTPNYTGQLTASFDFELDFGDRDGDGLFDDWEENGIDFDGDGHPEIDLRAHGADPNKKDLFVEVDVMENVFFDQEAIDDVVRAFADAPASAVNNPGGEKGIRLHVILDGDRPGNKPLVLPGGGVLPFEYYEIKEAFFGSDQDRIDQNWQQIRDTRLMIYRYCLWADTMTDPPPNGGHLFGVAEAIPSNDFIVAAGRIMTRYQDIPTAKLSATFMHELGHTLNLRHGGQNNNNRKPNYLSVMNYAYSVPFTITTAQGTNVADYWRLDYSRKAMRDVSETASHELPGLGGPAGRRVYFNAPPATDPEAVRRVLHRAFRPYINWNGNDERDEGPYPQDLTRNSTAAEPHLDSTLKSFTDWDRLWYHLGGSSNFDDREPWPYASPAEGLEEATIEAFNNVEWIDLTVLDDLIFANGFELGSTTAWSETVP